MLLEGTSPYFWFLFLIIVLVYITKKISLYFIFKKARIKPSRALIPFVYRLDLVDAIHINRKVAIMAYIPFIGIKYRKVILDTLLTGFGLDSKDWILFILFPMYKYPELAFKNVTLIQNDYSLTETFLESEDILFGDKENVNNAQIPNTNINKEENSVYTENSTKVGMSIPNNISYEPQMVGVNNQTQESVFTNENLVPDEHHETYVEAPKEEKPKEEKPIIQPLETGKPKTCPKCGAKLSPGAQTCFLCGTHL